MSEVSIEAIDLFCGVGGLTHGLEKAGVKVIAGYDIDSECRFSYEANNKARFECRDVSDVTGAELAEKFSGESVSLLAGCAPCQPFSAYSQGRRRSGDDWRLLTEFGRLVREVQPDLVTMENVPQLSSHAIFQEFLISLEGYSVSWRVVEAVKYSIPQTRKRLVLLASKLSSDRLDIPESTGRPKTVREAIGKLPILEAGETDPRDMIHTSPRLSAKNLDRIRASVPGGTWRDWPENLQADCHRKSSGATYSSVYGRMMWDRPSPTITTQSFGYGNGRFGHPEQDRAISLREAAIIQSFPRRYKFVKPGTPVRFNVLGRLIGNAVPVRLGEVIGEVLLQHVNAAAMTE